MKLYHYWRSSASWRVRWALEIKKIPHEKIAVDLLSGQEKEETYLRKNPSGYVPALIVQDKVLGESLAILEWLEENYSSPSLFSGDSFQRAQIRRLAETVNSGIQPLQNLDVLAKVSADKAVQAEWIRHWVQRGLGVVEKLLNEVGGKQTKFSFSDQPSMADLCLIPQCYSAVRFNVNLSAFPKTAAIYQHALTTPECAAAHPEKFQPK